MRVSLRLYITSSSNQSEEALQEVEKLKTLQDKVHVDLEVVDVLADPSSAERDQITVTPTLLILSPLPIRRMIGSLENLAKEIGIGEKKL